MDRTSDFGSDNEGSNPSEATFKSSEFFSGDFLWNL